MQRLFPPLAFANQTCRGSGPNPTSCNQKYYKKLQVCLVLVAPVSSDDNKHHVNIGCATTNSTATVLIWCKFPAEPFILRTVLSMV